MLCWSHFKLYLFIFIHSFIYLDRVSCVAQADLDLTIYTWLVSNS
jgi:hypothetical protein